MHLNHWRHMVPESNFRSRLQTLALVLLLVANAVLPQSAVAQDPLGGLAIGAGLTVLANKINEAIERAVGGGLILEIQAGGQVSLLLQQAQQTFEHEKDLTFSQLNGEEQKIINSVASVANDFLTKADAEMNNIASRAQAIVHDLPFSSTFPQAWKITPGYFEKTGSAPLRVELVGDFHDVVSEDLDATLQLASKAYKNSAKDSGRVGFDIPMGDLTNAVDKPVANNFSVVVPYKQSCWLFLKCKHEAIFKGSVTALPVKLADIDVAISTTTSGTARQNVKGQYFEQESGDDDIKCGGEHADLAVHLSYPDSGWRVVPSSATWQVVWSQGNQGVDQDWWLANNCSTPLVACLCVSTEHHGLGTSGKVHAYILFTEEKDILNTATQHTPLKMGWGESRVIQIPVGGTWTGTYTKYDGKIIQFAGPYQDAFVQVSQTGAVITIATAPWAVANAGNMRKALNEKLPK